MLNHCVGGLVDVKANNKTFPAVQVMHQTVREFFLHPGDLVRRSHLNVTKKDALDMIELTCVRFLEIVCEEGTRLALHSRPGVNSVVRLCRHLKYLEERPLIKYSLEYLLANPKEWAPTTADRISILLDRVENSPPSLMMVVFSKLLSITTDRSFGVDTQYYFERLIFDAARKGYSTAIRNLLVVAPSKSVNVENEKNETPLHLAAGEGHYAATMFLLDSGAHREAKDVNGRTALHLAVLNRHEAIVQLLLMNNEELGNRCDISGQSALHLAVMNGDEDIVQVLLNNNANPRAKDAFGQTALHLAAQNGHGSIGQLLLANNADLQARDAHGRTAIYYAARNGHDAIVRMLGPRR